MSQPTNEEQESELPIFSSDHSAMVYFARRAAQLSTDVASEQLERLDVIAMHYDEGLKSDNPAVSDKIEEARDCGEGVTLAFTYSRQRLREVQSCTIRRLRNALNDIRKEIRFLEKWTTASPPVELLARCANASLHLDMLGVADSNMRWEETPTPTDGDLAIKAKSDTNGMDRLFLETVILTSNPE